jgi:hypothetical protein
MEELKKVTLDPVQLSIEPQTKFLVLKQGKNEVKITRDNVINMKKLREGKIEANAFCSTLTPRNRFTVAENGTITIVCKDDWSDNVVVIANHRKLDDLQRIQDFVDKNKGRIAWEREFKGRY